MWIQGHNNIKPTKDIDAELLAIKEDMSDEEARATLGEWLYHNPAFLLELIAGIRLFPFQEVIIKGWMRNDYSMAVCGRGLGKSYLAAIFAMLWAIYNPNNRIVIISFAFRASRRILEQIEKFINDKDATLLKACYPNDIKRQTDEWKLVLPNGSSIQCLPLGDGTKIRGIRADTLIIDEYAYLPENIISEVLQPFLVANNKIKEQRIVKEREDRLIAKGVMKESDRTKIEENVKVIFLSSACYQFEHMYKKFSAWIKAMTDDKTAQEFRDSGLSYFITRLSYEAAPEGLVNTKVIEDAKKNTSEAVFDREYRALFSGDSAGFFRMSKMQECTIPDGETPTLEIVGQKNAEYVLAIDVALSSDEESDHFAMCVLKIVQKADGKKIPMVVHSYALAGQDMKDYIAYFYFIIRNFNIVYIAIDASQGDNVEFLNAAVQSKLFQDNKIVLTDLDVDFGKDNFTEQPELVKRSYSRGEGRIVQKQPFLSPWQRTANEYMQGCFDRKDVLFGAKICANESASRSAASNETLMEQLAQQAEFKDMSIMQFVENQDRLIDMVKYECASIKVNVTDSGILQFKLPTNMKRSGGANRLRKDSYSALLLGIWATKIYLESQEVQVQTGPQDFPFWGF